MKNYGIDEKIYDKFCKGYTLGELLKEQVSGSNTEVKKPSNDELRKYDAAYSKLMSIYLAHCSHEVKERLQNKGMETIDLSIDTLSIFDPEIRKEAQEAMAVISDLERKYPGYILNHIIKNHNGIEFVRLGKYCAVA